MTFKDIVSLIESFGLPYTYYQWEEGTDQKLPFIVFYYTGSDDLSADNINYVKIRDLVIELYTSVKDFELEEQIEDALTAAGMFYAKEETRIDSEQMYEVLYSMQVVITKETVEQEEITNG